MMPCNIRDFDSIALQAFILNIYFIYSKQDSHFSRQMCRRKYAIFDDIFLSSFRI